jgi:hypothetical protein
MEATGRRRKSLKGQATVLGTVFFLVLLVTSLGTISYFTYSLNEYNEAMRLANEFDISKMNEGLEITSAYLNSNNNLIINMTNRGTETVHPTRLWIINSTDNTHSSYSFNSLYLEPGESASNVTQVTLTTGKEYEIRVVTERGNIASVNLAPNVQARINVLVQSPVFSETNVTIGVYITNNDSSNYLYNLTPTLTVTAAGGGSVVEGPAPTSVALLAPSESAVFIYTLYIDGTKNRVTVNASYVGAPQGNYVLDTTRMAELVAAASAIAAAATTMRYPIQSLTVYGSTPNPNGLGPNDKSYWGVTIANPHNRSITVYSVAAVASSVQLWDGATGINPTTGWTQTNPTSVSSMIYWQSATGVNVNPASTYSFIFEGEHKATAWETPVMIESLTSEGKFYQTFAATQDGNTPSINLYTTTNVNAPTTTSYMKYDYGNIPVNTTKTFNVTVWNSGVSKSLGSKVQLFITTPVYWTNITAASGQAGGYWGTPTITENDDSSHFIAVISTASTLNKGEAKVFSFNATSPAEQENAQLYIIPVISYYPDITAFPAIAEATTNIVVEVDPTA